MAQALRRPSTPEAPPSSSSPTVTSGSHGGSHGGSNSVHDLHEFVEAVMLAERLEAARWSPHIGFALIAVTSAFLWIGLGAIVF